MSALQALILQNRKLTCQHNFQDKAHFFINNEVFFSGTSEVYKRILIECISWNVFNLVFKQTQDSWGFTRARFYLNSQKRKKLSSERGELNHYQ